MRDRSDQGARRADRKPRIGVERDDVAHQRRGPWRRAARRDEARARRPPQQLVELVELPALALPSHPLVLARIPATRAVKEVESLLRFRRDPVP
jgi:hypothetical protein